MDNFLPIASYRFYFGSITVYEIPGISEMEISILYVKKLNSLLHKEDLPVPTDTSKQKITVYIKQEISRF